MNITRNQITLPFGEFKTTKRGTSPGGELYFAPEVLGVTDGIDKSELLELIDFIGIEESFSIVSTAYAQKCIAWFRKSLVEDKDDNRTSIERFTAMVVNASARVETLKDKLEDAMEAFQTAKKLGFPNGDKSLLMKAVSDAQAAWMAEGGE